MRKKKKKKRMLLINGGIYHISKNSFLNIDFPGKFSFEKDFLEKYFKTQRFFGKVYNQYFIDIGIPETYKKAQTDFLNEFSNQ